MKYEAETNLGIADSESSKQNLLSSTSNNRGPTKTL